MLSFKKILFVSASLLLLADVSAAEWSGQLGLELRGFTESAAYAKQHGNNSSVFFQPEFYHEFNDGNDSITFVPYLRFDQNDDERSHADIRELTWLKVQDNLEWRIGIRKLFWGVTESQHLVDIINQTDLVDNPDGEEKLGQPMINVSYNSELGTFDAFVLPYFRERTFAGQQGRLRSQPYVDTSTTFYESNDRKKHIDYALRWAHSIEQWDIGVSFFKGTSRTPRFVSGTDSTGQTVLNPYYDLIEQLGLDLQATYDSWLWKLEAIHRSDPGGTGASHFNAATAGLEYTFYSLIGEATDLGLVLEYLYDDRGLAAPTPFQKDVMLGLRFNLNDEQSTDALIGMIKDIDTDAIIYSLETSRRLTENFKISAEARFYSNIPSGQLLHAYLSDDYIQLELGYYF